MKRLYQQVSGVTRNRRDEMQETKMMMMERKNDLERVWRDNRERSRERWKKE